MDVVKSLVSGSVGGILNVIVGHPFDTIKVRMQTMPQAAPGKAPMFKGTFDCFQKTIRIEGFTALFKGLGSPLIYQTPIMAIFFAGNTIGRQLQGKNAKDVLTFKENFISGCIAGFLALFVRAPGERIKSLLQIQEMGGKVPVKYDGPIHVVSSLYKKHGIRSLYKGFFITMLRDVHASGLYFATYAYLKQLLSSNTNNQQTSPFLTIFAGGIAGMAFWGVNMPFDVIKSRVQTQPNKKYPYGMRSVIGEVYRQEGYKGFFKGTIPAMLRAFPANGATFLGVEMANNLFRKIEK